MIGKRARELSSTRMAMAPSSTMVKGMEITISSKSSAKRMRKKMVVEGLWLANHI